MPIRPLVLLAVAFLLAACGTDEPVGIDGFETTEIAIDGREMTVAVAETADQRSQGLMGVTDLGGIDGMLFVFPSDSGRGFWMKNTLVPLDIAFFDVEGILVDRLAMDPCTGDPCPVYEPGGPYRHALEAPAGDLAFMAPGARLDIGDRG